MKRLLTIVLVGIISSINGQNILEWDGIYQLKLVDFQSTATQIGNTSQYSLFPAASFNFSFSMTRGEFIFIKNFNSKVNCTFNRNAAEIVAPDSAIANSLVLFSRFEFDLAELYARKFRKKLFEKKGTFSSATFFKPIYDTIQSEMSVRQTTAGRITDIGRDFKKLEELHLGVLNEIQELSSFCKTCTPPKKRK